MRIPFRHSKGFSFLEVIIAVFIFSLIMVGVTSYFVSTTVANQNTKRLQQNLEDVRFAMNRIAKVLRTSVVLVPNTSSKVDKVRVYDYSQSKCIRYEFSGDGMREYEASLPSGEPDEKTWCLTGASFGSPGDIVSVANGATLSGTFFVVPSSDTAGSEVAGRVTMNATITRKNNASTIQTTVSLRNYKE